MNESQKKHEELDDLTLLTIEVINIGADKKNLRILKLLPSTIAKLMQEVKLSKSRVNTRVNDLQYCGLLERHLGTSEVILTYFGSFFISTTEKIKEKVEKHVIQHLRIKETH